MIKKINKYNSTFMIKEEDLSEAIKKLGWDSVEEFLSEYTYDDGEEVYKIVKNMGNEFDIVHEVIMAIDEVAMAKGLLELDESCDELIEKFNSDYDEILIYLSEKYEVIFN